MKPLAIDLYCGLGGWAEGFLSEGYRVVGFDIERHDYGTGRYPGELVLRDVRSIHGTELVREYGIPAVIVGSSPCQEFSYRAMPWKRAKALPPPYLGMELFEAQFRIQREAIEAAGRYIPMIIENVRGAQKWVGRAKWHFGSYYLWGDVPALMPIAIVAQKFNPDGTAHPPGSWFAIASSKNRGARSKSNPGTHERTEGPGRPRFIQEHVKVPGMNWSGHGSPDYKPKGFNVTAAQRYREGVKSLALSDEEKTQLSRGGKFWPGDITRRQFSRSDSRKAASAQIAKIPFPLAQHIARCFKPNDPDPSCPISDKSREAAK